jgi:hypothetical protein
MKTTETQQRDYPGQVPVIGDFDDESTIWLDVMGNGIVTIYGIATGDHIHYAGSTTSIRRRVGQLFNRGKEPIRTLLRTTAHAVVIKRCPIQHGYCNEGYEIARLKAIGQCELNKNVPRKEFSRHYVGFPIKIVATGQSFPSHVIAAITLGVSVHTLKDMKKRGEAVYDWPE